jgi:pentatricopeptide repeat protein
MFTLYSGDKDIGTLHAIVGQLAVEGRFQEAEDAMYHMRSNYSISADDFIWATLINEGSRIDWPTGKKYFMRMLKNGPLISSIRPAEVLMKSMSKADAWKDVTNLYNNLKGQESWLSQMDAKFYENMLYYNARKGRWKEAVYWMDEMKSRNIVPTHKCFRFAVDSCHKGNKAKLAVDYMDQMLETLAEGVDLEDRAAEEERLQQQKD